MLDFALAQAGPVAIRYPRDEAPAAERPDASRSSAGAACCCATGVTWRWWPTAPRCRWRWRRRGCWPSRASRRPWSTRASCGRSTSMTLRDLTERFSSVSHDRGAFEFAGASPPRSSRSSRSCTAAPISIRPIAIPDAFIPHGSRSELLRELRFDPTGLAAQVSEALAAPGRRSSPPRGRSARRS